MGMITCHCKKCVARLVTDKEGMTEGGREGGSEGEKILAERHVKNTKSKHCREGSNKLLFSVCTPL